MAATISNTQSIFRAHSTRSSLALKPPKESYLEQGIEDVIVFDTKAKQLSFVRWDGINSITGIARRSSFISRVTGQD